MFPWVITKLVHSQFVSFLIHEAEHLHTLLDTAVIYNPAFIPKHFLFLVLKPLKERAEQIYS